MKILRIIINLKSCYYYLKGLWLLKSPKFFKSIPFFEKSISCTFKNIFNVYSCKKYIGIAYYDAKQYRKAKDYLLEAKDLIPHNDITRMDSELLSYLGCIFDAEADLKKAKEYYQLALRNYKKIDEFTDIDYINSRLIKIDEWFRENEK